MLATLPVAHGKAPVCPRNTGGADIPLFRDKLVHLQLDEDKRIRVDDWELSEPMQAELKKRWAVLNTENLAELADLAKYREEFMKLFGFAVGGVDYSKDVDPRVVD